jgi:oligopeptidase B
LVILVCGSLSCHPVSVRSGYAPPAPVAATVPERMEMHGICWTDYFSWMKDIERSQAETIAYAEEENAYTDAIMAHTVPLQEKLYEEMKGRIKETDLGVPVRRDDYYYYSRTEEGLSYRIFCRKKGSLAAEEEITLDVNLLAAGRQFYQLGHLGYSPDHELVAFSADTSGAEKYVVRFKELATGRILKDELYPVKAVTWANDNRTIFYVREEDPDVESPYQLYRHVLGTAQDEDILIYQEEDVAFGLWVQKTRSKAYIVLNSGDNNTSEIRYLSADDPYGAFRLMEPRQEGVEYAIQHREGTFFIATNDGGAKNYKVMRTPVERPSKSNWTEFIAHRDSVYISAFDVFRDYIAVHERREGLEEIRVIDMPTGETHYIGFPEPTYAFFSGANPNYDADEYRIIYTSLVTPRSVYDYDFETRELKLMKRSEVLGGFDAANYTSERLHAEARDGTWVPISLVYRTDLFHRDGTNPLLLYGYGAYGIPMQAFFWSPRVSLLDRGFVYAIAHVRGGDEMGETWHEQGKLLKKKNTFRDFIDCAEHLLAAKYTSREALVIEGGSAGGMLMGVVANMRPDLFRVVLAEVPAVDEFTHMLDPALPGVEFHYGEWGNPNVVAEFKYMRSWDAYQNISVQAYPDMLVTAGLHDPRVPYWEPVKYVAKLRKLKRGDSILLLKTEMSGHMGASGRYDFLREMAFGYAFILDRLGIRS